MLLGIRLRCLYGAFLTALLLGLGLVAGCSGSREDEAAGASGGQSNGGGEDTGEQTSTPGPTTPMAEATTRNAYRAYTLDGKKSKNDLNFGTQESVAKWSKDGKMLVIESTMDISRGDRDITIESTEKWSLDKDTLTIERTRSTPRGDRTSKAVYDKVKKEK